MHICPSERETALLILAEYIEDCSKHSLQTKIINFLGQEGPKAKNSSTYIRFIYNRINLEKPVIRAAAISALASFAFKIPDLRKSILLLLKRCIKDNCDEVRERTLLYISMLEKASDHLNICTDLGLEPLSDADGLGEIEAILFQDSFDVDIDALEQHVTANQDQLIAMEDFQIDAQAVKSTRSEPKPKVADDTTVSSISEVSQPVAAPAQSDPNEPHVTAMLADERLAEFCSEKPAFTSGPT